MKVRTKRRQLHYFGLRAGLLIVCANLIACGQLGPLYLPGEGDNDSEQTETTSSSDTTAEEQDNDDGPGDL